MAGPTIDRAAKRQHERRARERRAANLRRMRHTHEALELALVVSHTMDSVDAAWEDFLDERAIRVRRSLRRSVQLSKEAAALRLERSLLLRLLEEHRLASQALMEAMNEPTGDDWSTKVARWRDLASRHFRQWTLDECEAEMDAILKDVSAFEWSLDKVSTGLSFLGWREQRRLDLVRGTCQYQFDKTYRGFDMMDSINTSWDMLTESKMFVVTMGTPHCAHEVLQQLGPNAMLILAAERSPALEADVHTTFLVFRVKTDEGGVLQCARTVYCPELVKVFDEPTDLWTSTFSWMQWNPLESGEIGYRYRVSGSFAGKDTAYLSQWILGIFAKVLRRERIATRRQLLTSE